MGRTDPWGLVLTSPIPQVDGAGNTSDPVRYKFVSDFHRDDIGYTLEELFPSACATLVWLLSQKRVQIETVL